MKEKKRFVYNDWMTTSEFMEGSETEFSVVINYPDANTFPALMELRQAVEKIWKRNRRDFYCPVSPWEVEPDQEIHDFSPDPLTILERK
jgi:hypothetical protein